MPTSWRDVESRRSRFATGMANYHSCDEYITVDNLNGCARLVEQLVLEARE